MLAMATELGADNSTVMQEDDGDDLWHNDVGAATLLLGVGRAVGVMALVEGKMGFDWQVMVSGREEDGVYGFWLGRVRLEMFSHDVWVLWGMD
ncbi:hypothetical protein MRB53_005461 [Persea americana]|uniref:Uncharacterized protein n=1 Tax=Persea americana TaxID=3435 RepID=A0ACC2ME44_PERAE|nr:hypothetical protein MRB53_005461 [Persea americana]